VPEPEREQCGVNRFPAVIKWTANALAAVLFGLLHLPNFVLLSIPITLGTVLIS
jgi:membrane protease YdiL (CAAX protease family)